ncbi:hypothetical protein [Tabrizicola sp.]|uniref:hypothetical protein n=1 Tax=Tabrizicola sp. TaxID=2005166 RepID=UPI002869FD18|nr:hypothetical protein [Tabrizicola sp.]
MTKTIVLAPTFRHREQWQVPIIVGLLISSNFTAPQQQLPSIIHLFPSDRHQIEQEHYMNKWGGSMPDLARSESATHLPPLHPPAPPALDSPIMVNGTFVLRAWRRNEDARKTKRRRREDGKTPVNSSR